MTRLALVGGDDALRDELLAVLRTLPDLELLPGRAADGAELLLVAGDDELSAHDRCRSQSVATPCILVVEEADDGDAAREAMAAGARAIVGRPVRAFQLARAADAARSFLPAGRPVVRVRGRVVALTGAAGGVGVSTLTTALIGLLEPPVALLDLDPTGGVLARMLGAGERSDAAGLAGEDSGRRAYERLAEPLPHGALVASPLWCELAWTIRDGVARELVDAAALSCPAVLVDAGRGVGPAMEALQVADLVLVVTRPGVVGTEAALRHRQYLARIGVPDERVRVCRNACGRRDVLAGRAHHGPLGDAVAIRYDEDLVDGHLGDAMRRRLADLVVAPVEAPS